MKIALACDHGALELKNTIRDHLQKLGHEVVDRDILEWMESKSN